MGLFDTLFGKRPKPRGDFSQFKMLNGYTPQFTSYSGGVYESELIRASINARATHISKLEVEITGSANHKLKSKLMLAPNRFQTWGQFLYRLSTILDIHNTAFITPVYDEYGDPAGVFAPLPKRCEIVQYGGILYLRYEFSTGEKAAIELSKCGILTKYQYQDDFLGEDNQALYPTMELIHIQNQGIEEGVKSAATYRFMAQLSNFAKAEDVRKERKRFTEENFKTDDGGGMLLFPSTYTNVKQIDVKPWVVDAEQMAAIRANVFEYFGVNEDILQNKAYGDAWSAFYEGAIEPFAIQFSDVMSTLLFTHRERATGNKVVASANRLQYLSNKEKLDVSSQMLDRGIMSINDIRNIWNLPPVEDGDKRIIRGEYWDADKKLSGEENGEGN